MGLSFFLQKAPSSFPVRPSRFKPFRNLRPIPRPSSHHKCYLSLQLCYASYTSCVALVLYHHSYLLRITTRHSNSTLRQDRSREGACSMLSDSCTSEAETAIYLRVCKPSYPPLPFSCCLVRTAACPADVGLAAPSPPHPTHRFIVT